MKAKNIIKLLILLLFLNTKGTLHAQSNYKVAEQDSLALLAFYKATDGSNWISNQDGFGFNSLTSEWQGVYSGGFNKWLEGPIKDWFGVTVEKLPIPNSTDSVYRVVRIWPVIGRRTDGLNELKGYIPREVGLLTALKDFRVNGNPGFTGTEIPDDLYHKSLEYLDIEASWFDGEISNAFRNCTGIRKMNFRYNNIDYMPTFDFLSIDALNNLSGTQWFYSTQLSLAIFEKSVEYFNSVSDKTKAIQIEMRDVNHVGDEIEIVAPIGSATQMECTAAGEKEEFITYQWYKNGLSRFGQTKRVYSISNVKESDYGDYTVKITNDYVKEFDENTNWGEVYTKVIHLVPEPVSPVIEWAKTSYNGKKIQLRFSKPMNKLADGYEDFSILAGGRSIQAVAAKTEGRLDKDFILTLNEEIKEGEILVLNYTGNKVIDKNSGVLQTVSNYTVDNLVRTEPAIITAQTTKDGTGIELMFNNYIDATSINKADFAVIGNNTYSIVSATLKSGKINNQISKVVLLTLSTPITDNTELLKVSYTKGNLSGFLSGVTESFSNLNVTNQVILDNTDVLLYFEDGSGKLGNALIQASWTINPIQLYDDGTNGDQVANDKIWTVKTALVDEKYTWDVIARETIQTYDTVSVTDPETGVITQTITPVVLFNDTVLSGNIILEFVVENDTVTGLTRFGIMNVPVTFNVTLNESSDEVFLMGIKEDWGTGIPMIRVGDSNVYSVTLNGYTNGDILNYNYRNGGIWENNTAESRSYKVEAGENIINDKFSVFTALDTPENKSYKLYPNPVNHKLNITSSGTINFLEIYNVSGQIMYSKSFSSENFVIIDVSHFEDGIYYLRITEDNGILSSQKFIKIK